MRKLRLIILPLLALTFVTACQKDQPQDPNLPITLTEAVADDLGTNTLPDQREYLLSLTGTDPSDGASSKLVILLRSFDTDQPMALPVGRYYVDEAKSDAAGIIPLVADNYFEKKGGGNQNIASGFIHVAKLAANGGYHIYGKVSTGGSTDFEFTFSAPITFTDKSALVPSAIVDFEDAVLESNVPLGLYTYNNILTGVNLAQPGSYGPTYDDVIYSSAGANFGSYYLGMTGFTFWCGIGISSNNDLSLDGEQGQFSVHAPSNSKFAVVFDVKSGGMAMGGGSDIPYISFDDPCELLSFEIANNNYAYNYCKTKGDVNGDDLYLTLIIKGHLEGAETESITIDMARGESIIEDWTEVSLAPLGTVDKITFHMDSNDRNSMGILAPAYFCMDNLKIK